MEICKATIRELPQIYANVHETWPHHSDLETHIKMRLASVQHQYASWYLLRDEGQIVASLGWYPYEFKVASKIVLGAGIGAVHTPTAFRGRGYARALLEEVQNIMRSQGVAVCHLYSDIDPNYYKRLGYQLCPTVHIKHHSRQASTLPLQLSPWTQPKWQDRQELIEKFAPAYRIHRNEKHWHWLDQRYPETQYLLIQDANGERLGYFGFAPPYRQYPSQLLDAVWSAQLSWTELSALVEHGAWLLNIHDEFVGWYPQELLGDKAAGDLAQREIPMLLFLDQSLPSSIVSKFSFFPADHI